MKSYDVLIEGSGPAGSTCALALRDTGLRVAVLDKATFPRDKVCGDAIPNRAFRVLRDLNPAWVEALEADPTMHRITGFRIASASGPSCRLPFGNGGHTCPRLDFDAHLYELARRHSRADFFAPAAVRTVTTSAEGVEVVTATGERFGARLIVGSGGAHSVVARTLTDTAMDKAHYCGAVRAYYENVAEMDPDTVEAFISRQFEPAYFWMFPLADGRVNVGFGMRSKEVSAQGVRLREALGDFIASVPELRRRFAKATPLGRPVGFGLPMGSRRVPISGLRFLLTGDAAALIDPLSGEGIGNAMWSAQVAARHIQRVLATDDCSAEALRAYDEALYAKLGPEMRLRYRMQRAAHRMPLLVEAALWGAQRSKRLQRVAQRWV